MLQVFVIWLLCEQPALVIAKQGITDSRSTSDW